MFARIVAELGPWSWWVLGMVLLIGEIVLPGVFLVWIGIAAIAVGAISLLQWDAAFWTWQSQLIVFAALSVLSVFAGRQISAARSADSDQPLLNKRGESLVGRTAILEEPIREGQGRIRIGDTLWIVSGPDLPAGRRVRVARSDGRELTVEEA